MIIGLVFLAGVGYAGFLWLIATCVAHRRMLRLGSVPYGPIAFCGAAATGCTLSMAPETAFLAAATLIGAVVCAVVDARTGYIFDALTLSMIAVAGVTAAQTGRFSDGAVAIAVVGGGLASLYFLTGRRGIGLGDVKLGSAIALGYGLQSAIVAIGSAFVLGAGYAVVMLVLGRVKRSDALRFGPFIAGGAAVALGLDAASWRW